jgi:biopolymer transport protein ExbB
MLLSYIQDVTPLQTEKTLSLLELIKNGGLGGQLIIGVLFVLLLMVTYIYFERLFAIRSAVKVTPNFMPQIRSFVMNGKLDGAQQLCVQENVPVARLISKGLSRIGRPLDDINTAIENAGRLEVYQLEKNISILATISGAAPMLGFLGTVIGMILSIFEISNAGGILTCNYLPMVFTLQ